MMSQPKTDAAHQSSTPAGSNPPKDDAVAAPEYPREIRLVIYPNSQSDFYDLVRACNKLAVENKHRFAKNMRFETI